MHLLGRFGLIDGLSDGLRLDYRLFMLMSWRFHSARSALDKGRRDF